MEALELRRYFDWEQLDWANSAIPDPINEGDAVQMHLHILKDSSDWFSASLDYGDGGSDGFSNSEDYSQGYLDYTDIDADVSHTFGDSGTMTLTITNPLWYDPWSYTNSYYWSINNIQPFAQLGVDYGDGGGQYTVSLANASDPSEADTAAGFHYSFATSYDGLANTYGTAASQGFDLEDSAGVIWARIFDKDGGYSDYNTSYVLPTINWNTVNGWDTRNSTSFISFSWLDVADGEAGWRVQRSSDGTNFTTVEDLPANSASYTDSNVLAGQRFWYRVRAFGNGQDTAYSAKRAITVRPPNPSNLKATPDSGGTSATLAWSPTSDPTSSLTLSGYEVYQKIGTGSSILLGTAASTATSFAATDLDSSNNYSYVVRALWSNGFYTDSIETPLVWTAPNDLAINTPVFNFSGDPNKQSLTVTFPTALTAALTSANVELTNIATGDSIALNLPTSGSGGTITFNTTADPGNDRPAGVLPDGNYQLRVLPGLQSTDGKSLSRPYVFEFFAYAGDADHNRQVNGADLTAVTAHWQQPGTFAQGDFNYDGYVDIHVSRPHSCPHSDV
jgi:hypothetical protein